MEKPSQRGRLIHSSQSSGGLSQRTIRTRLNSEDEQTGGWSSKLRILGLHSSEQADRHYESGHNYIVISLEHS